MRQMNKKGFTLVELIVVIAIMGVILILALPQVGRIRANNRDAKFDAYAQAIERGAKLYVDNYSRDLFGYSDSGCVEVKYSWLKNKNLVKDFSDKDIDCGSDETYVQIRKVNDNYRYATAVVCKRGEEVVYKKEINSEFTCDTSKDISGPIFTVTPPSSDWIQTKNLHITVKVSDPSGLNNNIGISYYWTNLSGTQVGTKYYHNYKNKKDVESVKYTIPTSHVPDTGQYKLVIEPWDGEGTVGVQDSLGNYKLLSDTYGTYKIDNVPPKCVTVGGGDQWFHEAVTLYGNCTDEHSGCVKKQISKVWDVEIMDEYVTPGTVEDHAENKTECPKNRVRIDKPPVKPTISNPTNGKWTNKDFTITMKTVTASSRIGHWEYKYDNGSWQTYSNSASNTHSMTISSDKSGTLYVRACTNASGICSEAASTTIRLDKTNPSCSSWKENTWTTGGVTVKYSCGDNLSGVVSCPGTRWGLKSGIGPTTIKDNAGNTATCPGKSVASAFQYNTATRRVRTCTDSCCGLLPYDCNCSSKCTLWKCTYYADDNDSFFAHTERRLSYQCPSTYHPTSWLTTYLGHSECIKTTTTCNTCYRNKTCTTVSCCGYTDWSWTGWGNGYWCSSNTCKYQTRTVYY